MLRDWTDEQRTRKRKRGLSKMWSSNLLGTIKRVLSSVQKTVRPVWALKKEGHSSPKQYILIFGNSKNSWLPAYSFHSNLFSSPNLTLLWLQGTHEETKAPERKVHSVPEKTCFLFGKTGSRGNFNLSQTKCLTSEHHFFSYWKLIASQKESNCSLRSCSQKS